MFRRSARFMSQREGITRLGARRMMRGRRMCQMDLPQRRHGRKRDRDAKSHDEGEKSQTWSHCYPPPGIKQTRWLPTVPMMKSWSRLHREWSHTTTHEEESGYVDGFFCATRAATGGISPSSQSCSSASAVQASAIRK